MSWLFSQALVEAYSEDISLDGEQSAPLNGNPTQQAYLSPDKMTDFSRLSRFGMTFKPLTADRGEDLLMSYLEDFHVKTSAAPGAEPESQVRDQECGNTWLASLAKYDHVTSMWKTAQCSLLEDLEQSLETWPRWGLMRNGECWEQPMWERLTNETESGSWPTPTCGMATHSQLTPEASQREMDRSLRVRKYPSTLAIAVQAKWPTPTAHNAKEGAFPAEFSRNTPQLASQFGGKLNPMWVEWLMGWPLGWTDLKPLETDKFRLWLQQHGQN
jgi:hypothetical protein